MLTSAGAILGPASDPPIAEESVAASESSSLPPSAAARVDEPLTGGGGSSESADALPQIIAFEGADPVAVAAMPPGDADMADDRTVEAGASAVEEPIMVPDRDEDEIPSVAASKKVRLAPTEDSRRPLSAQLPTRSSLISSFYLYPDQVINYASQDAGAVVLESAPGSKGFANLLVDDRDKYAISPCAEKKWVVIGLSEDIRVRAVTIANYEKYSSTVKEFQVLLPRLAFCFLPIQGTSVKCSKI